MEIRPGGGARFTASDTAVAAWIGAHLHILDQKGAYHL